MYKHRSVSLSKTYYFLNLKILLYEFKSRTTSIKYNIVIII